MNTVIAVVWLIFMVVAVISAILKKAKQEEARASGEGPEEPYIAPEEDIRAFLEQIAARPAQGSPESPAKPRRPIRVPAAAAAAGPRPVEPPVLPAREASSRGTEREALVEAARKRRAGPPAPPKPDLFQRPELVSELAKAAAVEDPMALTGLSTMQRAIVWREILDPPPGLRAGAFFPREV